MARPGIYTYTLRCFGHQAGMGVGSRLVREHKKRGGLGVWVQAFTVVGAWISSVVGARLICCRVSH